MAALALLRLPEMTLWPLSWTCGVIWKIGLLHRCVFTWRTIFLNFTPIRFETMEPSRRTVRTTTRWVAIWDQFLIRKIWHSYRRLACCAAVQCFCVQCFSRTAQNLVKTCRRVGFQQDRSNRIIEIETGLVDQNQRVGPPYTVRLSRSSRHQLRHEI